MTSIKNQTQNDVWKQLSSISVTQPPRSGTNVHCSICSYYVDIYEKEWIVILLPQLSVPQECDSYLYDVENDKFKPFIRNYNQDINRKFNISHVLSAGSMTGHSHAIDNDNHILYWLQSSHWRRSLLSIDIKNLQNIKLIDQTLLPLSIDHVSFCQCSYAVLVTGNTIQFILGEGSDTDSLKNFQFDINTKKLSLIHENIHLKSGANHDDDVRKLKLNDLKIGDYIDVKSSAYNCWYLAKIDNVTDKKYYNCEYDNNNSSNDNSETDLNLIESMKISVHDAKDNHKRTCEWIDLTGDSNEYSIQDLAALKRRMTSLQTYNFGGSFVNIDVNDLIDKLKNGTSICDCNGKCEYHDIASKFKNFDQNIAREFNKHHRIALPKCQSLYDKSLYNLHGLYSTNSKTMIILGENKQCTFGGVYCKRIGHSRDYFQSIFNGFIKQYFKQMLIPKDLCQLIFNYFFLPNDKDWIHLSYERDKKDGNAYDVSIPTINDAIFDHDTSSNYVVVNELKSNFKHDEQHIIVYTFSSASSGHYRYQSLDNRTISRLDIDMEKYCYTVSQLKNIKCPTSKLIANMWHVIFCQKSQTIHLFERNFAKHYSIKIQTLNNATTVAQ